MLTELRRRRRVPAHQAPCERWPGMTQRPLTATTRLSAAIADASTRFQPTSPRYASVCTSRYASDGSSSRMPRFSEAVSKRGVATVS
eukprot:scaffold257569_cov32-Tisochrysis_lutea.AAC.2